MLTDTTVSDAVHAPSIDTAIEHEIAPHVFMSAETKCERRAAARAVRAFSTTRAHAEQFLIFLSHARDPARALAPTIIDWTAVSRRAQPVFALARSRSVSGFVILDGDRGRGSRVVIAA